MAYAVTPVSGVQPSSHRGIAFLDSQTDCDVDAKDAYDTLPRKKQQDVLNRFDYWLSGGICKKYSHGWDQEDREHCFTFKWTHGSTYHRLYGFLCHPRESDPRFEACVLVLYRRKNDEATDPSALNIVNRLRVKPEILSAIKLAFDEKGREKGKHGAGALDHAKR